MRYVRSLTLLLLAGYNFELSECTEIKWESAAKKGETDPAKIAPKSQRYWDENNIERPDYAKTDAEVASEVGNRTGLLAALIACLLVTSSLFLAHYFKCRPQFGGGQRLGSNNSTTTLARLSPFQSTTKIDSKEERARQARLQLFENAKVK